MCLLLSILWLLVTLLLLRITTIVHLLLLYRLGWVGRASGRGWRS